MSYLHELHRDFATRSHQSLAELAYYSLGECVYMCICTLKHGQLLCAPRGCLPRRKILQFAQPASRCISFKRAFSLFLLLRPAHQHQLSRLINYCLMPEQASHHFNRIRSGRGAWSDNCRTVTEHQEYMPAPHYSPAFFSNLHTPAN